MAYKSPEGTFEPLLKSFLEDTELTPPAHRLVTWLAAKPAGWVVNEKQLCRELVPATRERHGITKRQIRDCLTELRAKGYLKPAKPYAVDGQIRQSGSTLVRNRVVKTANRPDVDRPDVDRPDVA